MLEQQGFGLVPIKKEGAVIYLPGGEDIKYKKLHAIRRILERAYYDIMEEFGFYRI